MKRLVYCAGIVLSLGFFSSCAQHDSNSPDTSGAQPYNQPGVGVDTVGAGPTPGTGTPNANNNQSNDNQQLNTGDTLSNQR